MDRILQEARNESIETLFNPKQSFLIRYVLYNNYSTTIHYICSNKYKRNIIDVALEMNLEAYEYNTTNARILDNLATDYYMLEEYDKSLKIYEELMLEKPSFPSAYYYYAFTLLKLNKIISKKETFL